MKEIITFLGDPVVLGVMTFTLIVLSYFVVSLLKRLSEKTLESYQWEMKYKDSEKEVKRCYTETAKLENENTELLSRLKRAEKEVVENSETIERYETILGNSESQKLRQELLEHFADLNNHIVGLEAAHERLRLVNETLQEENQLFRDKIDHEAEKEYTFSDDIIRDEDSESIEIAFGGRVV